MFEGEDIAFNGLEVCSYRHLQGMAKNMGLPSNVKKVHLIEMIRAKKYCTETDLKAIVDRVKMERKVNAQVKKKKTKKRHFRLQGTEISSTSNSRSPPITLTPKRPSDFAIEYSPELAQTLMKYRPMANIVHSGSSILPLKRHIDSDRVLRSFNSGRRPNYRIMEQSDSIINALNHDPMQEIEQESVQQIRQERAYQSVTNVTIQKNRQMNAMVLNADRHLVPMSRSLNIPKPVSRQRKLSGIYALEPRETPTVGFRRSDGRVTKINAVIQKPLCNALLPKNHSYPPKKHTYVTKRATVTVQDMINYKIDHANDPKRAIESPGNSRLYHEIDRQIFSDYKTVGREVHPSQVDIPMPEIRIEPISTITEMTGRKELNQSRRVYKACPKSNTNKGWNYSVDYQEHETDARKWNIYDINGQLLDKTDQNALNIQSNYRVKDITPVSTNYKVTQGRITQPVSRDYQVEYQRFNQELTDRISNIARTDMNGQTLNAKKVRNIDKTRSDANDQRFDQEMMDRTNNATSDVDDQRLNKDSFNNTDHAKLHPKDPFIDQEATVKNMADVRSDVEDQRTQDITATTDAKDQRIINTTEKNITNSIVKDQRCTQELAVRILDVRSDAKYRLNQETDKSMLYATSDMKDQYSQETRNKNPLARSDIKDQRYNQQVTVTGIDPVKADSKYQRSNLGTTYMNMIYATSDMKDQRCHQEVYIRNMEHARNQRQETNNNIYPRTNQEQINGNRFEHIESQYPNMQSLKDVFPNDDYSQEPIQMRDDSNFTVYYHKKIRAEQIKSQRERDGERLPRINDAFTQFNNVQYRGLSQPLYVQVSAESERVLPSNGPNNTCMIENLYNFKNQFLMNPPVLMIATTDTYCTYTTKTISTTIARPAVPDSRNNIPYQRADAYQQIGTNRSNPERPMSFGCYEVLSSSTNSLETTNSQELGANVTIPEMVEDALELISQDGDYMERIGMDVRMQCILCEWAGPKIILEYHIKKVHSQDIQQQERDEWSILLTLGELTCKSTWSNQVVQCGPTLYVLSSKHNDAGVLLLALSMIPTESEIPKRGRITVYNKISGRPYSYESEIKPLPDSMPYEYGLDCLTLDTGILDLIPNSANLRLVNGELVGSPGNAVIGRPELNDIEIVVYVKLID